MGQRQSSLYTLNEGEVKTTKSLLEFYSSFLDIHRAFMTCLSIPHQRLTVIAPISFGTSVN